MRTAHAPIAAAAEAEAAARHLSSRLCPGLGETGNRGPGGQAADRQVTGALAVTLTRLAECTAALLGGAGRSSEAERARLADAAALASRAAGLAGLLAPGEAAPASAGHTFPPAGADSQPPAAAAAAADAAAAAASLLTRLAAHLSPVARAPLPPGRFTAADRAAIKPLLAATLTCLGGCAETLAGRAADPGSQETLGKAAAAAHGSAGYLIRPGRAASALPADLRAFPVPRPAARPERRPRAALPGRWPALARPRGR